MACVFVDCRLSFVSVEALDSRTNMACGWPSGNWVVRLISAYDQIRVMAVGGRCFAG